MEQDVGIIGKNSAAGVSIVEIMISLVLVAIGLIAITTVFPNMAKHRKGIHEAEQAKMIATEVIEGLQYLSTISETGCPGLLSGGTGPVAKVAALRAKYTTNGVQIGPTKYTAKWNDPMTCSTSDISTVTVEVEWYKGSKKHNIKMTGALR
jgi:Tfp pilus assembly protein PilV